MGDIFASNRVHSISTMWPAWEGVEHSRRIAGDGKTKLDRRTTDIRRLHGGEGGIRTGGTGSPLFR